MDRSSWRDSWWHHQHLTTAADQEESKKIPNRLKHWNVDQTPIRSLIETLWSSIDQDDNWEPFEAWLKPIVIN